MCKVLKKVLNFRTEGDIIKSKIINLRFFRELYGIYKNKSVSTLSASLAFYMLFTVFPGVIVIKSVIDLISFDGGFEFVLRSLPSGTEELIGEYLSYTENFGSAGIIAGGIFVSLFSLVKFTRSLKRHIDEIHNSGRKNSYALSWIFSFVMSLYFLALLYLSLLCLVFGESVLKFLAAVIGKEKLFVLFWQKARVILPVILLFLFLLLVFAFLPDRKYPLKSVIPGVIFTECAWLLSSYFFSLYIEKFSRYSIIYGPLGTTVIMMLWFYILSNIILIGICINFVLSF